MRQVPLATVKDKFSHFAAAAADGEEIVITRHGRPYARLISVLDDGTDGLKRSAETVDRLRALRSAIIDRGDALPLETIVEMIREDRR